MIKLPSNKNAGGIFDKKSRFIPFFINWANPTGVAMIRTVKNNFVFSYPTLYWIIGLAGRYLNTVTQAGIAQSGFCSLRFEVLETKELRFQKSNSRRNRSRCKKYIWTAQCFSLKMAMHTVMWMLLDIAFLLEKHIVKASKDSVGLQFRLWRILSGWRRQRFGNADGELSDRYTGLRWNGRFPTNACLDLCR